MKQFITFLSIALFISCSNYGEKLTFDGTDVFYKEGATKEQAQKLGEYLNKSGFTDGNEKSVQLVKNKETGNLTFRMVVANDFKQGKDMVFKTFAKQLSKNVFNGEPLDFEICDNTFKTVKTFKFEKQDELVEKDGASVFYTKNVTKEDAQSLANYLKTSGFTDGTPKTIQLDKKDGNYLFRMVVKEGIEKDDKNVNMLKQFGDMISKNAFNGKPVVVHLCNDELETLRIAK